MKYVPKSKIAAAIAGAYLMLIFILFMVATFGETGLHAGNGFIAGLAIFLLTLPLSYVALLVGGGFLFPVIIVFSVLFNAALIYFLVAFVSRILQSLFKKPLK